MKRYIIYTVLILVLLCAAIYGKTIYSAHDGCVLIIKNDINTRCDDIILEIGDNVVNPLKIKTLDPGQQIVKIISFRGATGRFHLSINGTEKQIGGAYLEPFIYYLVEITIQSEDQVFAKVSSPELPDMIYYG